MHFHFKLPIFACAHFHLGLAHQPETLVAGSGLFQVLGQQVGVHLRLQSGDAFDPVNVFGRFGVKGECAKHNHLGRWKQVTSFVLGALNLPLLQCRVFRPETDHHPLSGLQVAHCMQVANARVVRQGFQIGKFEHLPAFAAYAGLDQFITPLVLTARLARASDAGVGLFGACGFVE